MVLPPGFTYCAPSDPAQAKAVPRRSDPRTAVPAGAVGIAGEFSAVYPRVSPGGWQLLGTTNTPMWDSHANPPALVQPGDRVRYRAVDELPDLVDRSAESKRSPARLPRMEVLDAGLLTLYQDLGRPGVGDLGVTPSGAADHAAAATANVAVGNPRGATVLENIGGIKLRALTDTVICVTGATARVRLGEMPVHLARPVLVTAGQTVTVGAATVGMRNYVAIRGGIIAESELGSSATDVLSGLGPDPVTTGDVDIFLQHGGDDGVAAGDGVVAQEDHRLAIRRDLDGTGHHSLGGQLAVFHALHGDFGSLCAVFSPRKPQANAIGIRGNNPFGIQEGGNIIAKPVIARS